MAKSVLIAWLMSRYGESYEYSLGVADQVIHLGKEGWNTQRIIEERPFFIFDPDLIEAVIKESKNA